MKLKQYGTKIEELRKEGYPYREIAEAVGLTREQVKWYFRGDRIEQLFTGIDRVLKSRSRQKQIRISENRSHWILASVPKGHGDTAQ